MSPMILFSPSSKTYLPLLIEHLYNHGSVCLSLRQTGWWGTH